MLRYLEENLITKTVSLVQQCISSLNFKTCIKECIYLYTMYLP